MSQDLRKKIISLHKKGEGYKKISKALLISQNTVAKVVQTFKKDGTANISQRRPGRPRKLTPRQERLLMRRVEENRHASSLQLSKEVESQTGGSVLMWGCMSAVGVWELPFIDGIMNSQMYCSILKEKMLPSLRALGRHALLQHDNDPKHTSKATVGFLKKNRVKVIQWPSMSPDLNPSERLWEILKRQVDSPSSIQSLKEVILEEWKKIDLAKCRQLVHFMPRRLGAVIRNHGGHTKY